ncbi:MAG: hypothetical protein JSW51_06680 [Gemmatimonadota bacterium]|nr:MAG: hypothetical protein JSW51_06680 [Gemmatimonadota bacterium]
METFADLKPMVSNPGFAEQRRRALAQLDLAKIDAPIVDIITAFAELPYCFTMQCCYGHFVLGALTDRSNLKPLPPSDETTEVEYRIAYLALCIAEGADGESLLRDLQDVTTIDPERIQFGCAEWFWQRQPNSYALQVEPARHQYKDSVVLGYQEALQIQSVRDRFFAKLRELLR